MGILEVFRNISGTSQEHRIQRVLQSLLSPKSHFSHLISLTALTLIGAASLITPAQAATPFASTYTANINGDIAAIGNTSVTCRGLNGTQATNCTDVQGSTAYSSGSFANNNVWQTGVDTNRSWQYVNIDTAVVHGFRDSSMAELKLPAGSTVRNAQLYWSVSTPASVNLTSLTAQIRHNSATAYTSVASTWIDSYTDNTYQRIYAARADVTALVQATGSGNYYVAGLSANDNGYTGAGDANRPGPQAGWSLVVTFENSALPMRNLNVFSGFQSIASTTNPAFVSSIEAHLTGLLTPPSGTVAAKAGWVALDGDRTGADGNLQFSSLTSGVCGAPINVPPNAMNPANNIGNSTISYLGVLGGYDGGSMNPSYRNTMGLDVDTFAANDFLGVGTTNSITSACVRLASSSIDGVFPLSLFTAINIFTPKISGAGVKHQANLTHPSLPADQAYAGDVIEYTINVNNTGEDAATGVVLTDVIPTGTTYVAGSLQVVTGANAGAKTDATGDDQAEISGSNITFRLGEGANSTTGGMLGDASNTTVSPDTQIRFQVRVNNNATGPITNTADIAYNGLTTGVSYTTQTNTVSATLLGTTLALNVQTTGAAGGPFDFTLSGTGQATGIATTAAANTPVQVDGDNTTAGMQTFTVTPGTNLVITQNSPPVGWVLSNASCTRDGVVVGSLSDDTYTVLAEDVYGAALVCTFTNTAPGSLEITKIITGGTSTALASLSGLVDLSITCNNPNFTSTVSLPVTGGIPSNTTVDNIPAGSICTVAETSAPAAPAGFEWGAVTYKNNPVTITSAILAQVEVTNPLQMKQTATPTPVPTQSVPMLLLITLCLLALGGSYAQRRSLG